MKTKKNCATGRKKGKEETSNNPSPPNKKKVMAQFTVFALVAVTVFAAVAAGVTCPPCSTSVCTTAMCGPSEPFYCEAGTSAGGCAATAGAWWNIETCSSCCDMSSCESRFSCTSGSCSKAMCESTNRCSFGDPYMCTAGHSTYGCSSNSSFWPKQPLCTACCDVTTCEFQCAPCTAEVCAANPCTISNPFVCTAGPLKNGCSSNPSYFGDQAQCYSCCDSRNCPP